jgi:hypothetical protein
MARPTQRISAAHHMSDETPSVRVTALFVMTDPLVR